MSFMCTNGVWDCDTAPVQLERFANGNGRVPLVVSEEGWKEYHAQYPGQTHEQLCARGGFGAVELAIFLYERIKRLERAREGDHEMPTM